MSAPDNNNPKNRTDIFSMDRRNVFVIVIVLFMILMSFLWIGRSSNPDIAESGATGTTFVRNDTSINPLVTPIPEEWVANRDQTIGIVIGGVLLVLIVVMGTVSTIRRKR